MDIGRSSGIGDRRTVRKLRNPTQKGVVEFLLILHVDTIATHRGLGLRRDGAISTPFFSQHERCGNNEIDGCADAIIAALADASVFAFER